MPLNLEHPDSQQYIRSVSADAVRVGEVWVKESFILTPDTLYSQWPVTTPQELNDQTLQPLLELEPELVVLGTGEHQVFPSPRLLAPFLQQGIGVEVMNSDAACRTFNVCVSENRQVVAGIILQPS